MFKKQTAEQISNMNEVALKDYHTELEKFNTEKEEKLNAQLKELETKSDLSVEAISTLKATIKKEINDIDLETFKAAVTLQGTVIKELQETRIGTTTVKRQINTWIEKNADKIAELKAAGSGLIELKVVGPMETTSASNPDGIPELMGVQSAAPGNVNLKGSIVDELVTTINTSLASYPYTETVPKDGDYAFVLEKGVKPQIDFKIETRYAAPKKVAAHMVLTDESVQDIPGLQSIANDYLRKKHDLKRQNGILFGDGIGANLTGATTYGRTFVAGGMALAVASPNFMDVVNACITDIYTTHNYTDEMQYMANIVMVNPVDFYLQLVAAKDLNGLPLYPMAGLMNRVVIGGATIIPFEDIPVGSIFVSDLKAYNTTR